MSSRRHSLFGKLFVIFAGLFILVISTFFISFKYLGNKRPFKQMIHQTVYNYSHYLVQDIGVPVTEEGLARVEKKTKVGIIFDELKSREDLPSLSQLKTTYVVDENYSISHQHGKKFVILKTQRGTYAFLINLDLEHKFPILPLGIATLVSLLFLLIAYHMVKRTFAPLDEIKEGAAHFARGDFNYPIPVKGKGELAVLSQSIKEMGEKIQGMLENKRDLLLAIAHELRTPLTRAKLHLELIEDSPKKGELNRDLNEMGELVNNILESERMNEGHAFLQLEKVNIKEWASALLAEYTEADLKVKMADASILIDSSRYNIVLKNLLSNAIRHGGDQSVSIELESSHFSVTNKGETIPPEEIPKLTEAFYRPEKSRVRDEDGGGVGLGLYLVSQIVKAHGHTLSITSKDGVTTFKITFN